MKIVMLVTLMAAAASAMPQFQLGVDPNQPPRSQPARPSPQQQQQFRPREEIIDTPEPYSFGLEVNDDEFTNYQSRQESQDENGVVRGQYSYVAPNGVRITVTYTADAINGYQATIKEEQTDIIVRNPVIAKEAPQPRGPPPPPSGAFRQ